MTGYNRQMEARHVRCLRDDLHIMRHALATICRLDQIFKRNRAYGALRCHERRPQGYIGALLTVEWECVVEWILGRQVRSAWPG
jgi:3-methyladenine DNA glycosylase/8-oxoguanine DNA glycosylase